MKKVLFTMAICFAMVFSAHLTVNANDVYIFSRNGMDYYVTYASPYSIDGNTGFLAFLVGVQNNKAADKATYVFFYGKSPKYIVTNGHDRWYWGRALRTGDYREYDYVANNSYAQTLYNYFRNNRR